MLNFKSLATASAVLTLFSGINAEFNIVKRNQEPSQPSCTDFTPFVYAGCFQNLGHPSPDALLYKGPDNENMTVETCVAFCKGNDYRYAGLEYYSECFCGASVNGPQVDESECDVPCKGNSSETCGANNRLNIYQDPTFPVVDDTIITDYQSIGCYSEGTSGRSLNWRQEQLSTQNLTIAECLFACKDNGFPIAGVEFGQECYCGVVLGNGTIPLDSSSCDMPCTGDSTEICGGRQTLNLYVAKDLESSQPCQNPGSSSSSTVSSTTTSLATSSTSAVVTTTSSSATKYTSLSSYVSSTSSTSGVVTTKSSSSSTVSTRSSTYVSSSSSSSSSTVRSTSSTSKSSSSVPTTSTTSSKSSTTSKLTTSTTSTKTTASLCTSTYTTTATPTCEYKCGSWCSSPLPTWSDKNSCTQAFSSCYVQVASCFLHAGWPESLKCFDFSSWCSSVSQHCGSACPGGNCNKKTCINKNPPPAYTPPAPVYSTATYTCPAASTTAKPSTTSSKAAPSSTTSSSCIPVPTASNICSQPHNPWKGYTSSSPVGNIELPCLTCNNIKSDYFSGNQFKLYTFADSSKCPSYSRPGKPYAPSGPIQGCKDACDSQYNSCMNTYAQGCKGATRGDNYQSASQKCKDQWNDCYGCNKDVNVGSGRCGSWNSGWY